MKLSITHTLYRKFKTATRLSRRQWAWLVPLFLMSGLARLAILLLPFRWLAPYLGTPYKQADMNLLATPAQEKLARELGATIKIVSKYTPWESKCLVQALLASITLHRHGIAHSSYLGVAIASQSGNPLQAHAWVRAGRCFVTGGRRHLEFTVVAHFISGVMLENNYSAH